MFIIENSRFLKNNGKIEAVIKEREKAMGKRNTPTLDQIKSWKRKVQKEFGSDVDLNDIDECLKEIYEEEAEGVLIFFLYKCENGIMYHLNMG